MKEQPIKYRQRVQNGEYHYWGVIDNTWVAPREDWGCIWDSEQWTGLYDKKNKEIYVNDIVEYWKEKHTAIIVFEGGSFVTKDDIYESEGSGGSLWQNRKHIEEDCEVIGSITDILYIKSKKKCSKSLSKSKKKKAVV